ncbi:MULTISPECIES: YibL family ribosome-associated protein [Vibrio]|uniref:YibL family ribosome-associated protein n=2 Tax=Vibrio TaxID=662 RepID=A0A7X4LNM2_9VIBR|nr:MULTISPECIES: YibL family ribosome-associated protein [Vibrio]MBF9003436.1 YibL family ribosome-associated protein [Vibrio nitrifigilis]MZI95283.1 YibL family ribosome-associated protein [Vibrio eleionomae]
MSLKTELQNLNNRLDTRRRKLDTARQRGDQELITRFTNEIDELTKKISQIKHKQDYEVNKKRRELNQMPFSRELTKAEQADLGKLKKSVKGLVVVHPMTKEGKLLQLEVMTGFAPRPF